MKLHIHNFFPGSYLSVTL